MASGTMQNSAENICKAAIKIKNAVQIEGDKPHGGKHEGLRRIVTFSYNNVNENCGLLVERAAALRAEVTRNKFASVVKR
jgi:hypothetical protein